MSDERIVCEVEAEVIRFHYSHHAEQDWTVSIVANVTDQYGTPALVLERALSSDEVEALVEAYLTAVLSPRAFTMGRDPYAPNVVDVAAAFLVGVIVAWFLYHWLIV